MRCNAIVTPICQQMIKITMRQIHVIILMLHIIQNNIINKITAKTKINKIHKRKKQYIM